MPLPESNLVMYVAGGTGGGGGSSRPPVVVDALPEIGRYGVTYLVPNGGTPPNIYDEYIWVSVEAGYELMGRKEVDLSHYVRDTRTVNGHALSANVQVTYADLQDKPSIEGVTLTGNKTAADLGLVPDTRKVGNVPLLADIPVTLTGDSAITVTNTGTASAIGYSIAHNDSGVTAGNKGDATNQTPGFGGTFKALSVTVNAKGHVTVLEEHSVKIPDAEATQSAKGLMSAADKKKLDTLIDATLSNTGKAADAKAAGDKIAALESENALLRELVNGIDAPIYRTASGNPAIFPDGAAANVKALSVEITPTQEGSGDPSPDNIRPISGVSSVRVTRHGKNLFDPAPFLTANWTESGGVYSGPPISVYSKYEVANGGYPLGVTFEPGARYTFSCDWRTDGSGRGIVVGFAYTDSTRSYVATPETAEFVHVALTSTAGKSVKFMYLSAAANVVTFVKNLQLEKGTSETAFESYQGQTVAVSLTDGANPLTVYGGMLDVTTGELTVTHTSKTLTGIGRYYTDEGSYRRFLTTAMDNGKPNLSSSYSVLSNMSTDKWVSGAPVNVVISSGSNRGSIYIRNDLVSADTAAGNAWLAEHPVQVYYPLETPLTYQLTPAQLATLSGYNSVSTDTGTVSVTYRADPSLTWGGGT